MTAKKKESEKEITQKLIDDANNTEAWGKPIKVPATRSQRPEWYGQRHLELAAKFYVLSVLHRLGAEANLTYAQPDNVDITVVRQSGEAFTIDVKTLTGTCRWPVEKFSARKHHYVVFICFESQWRDPQVVPDIYIWASQRLKDFIGRDRTKTVSLEDVASKLDARSAWKQFATQLTM